MYKISEIPTDERPRERLLKKGVEALSDHELLAIIIRSGTVASSAIDIAKSIIVQTGSLGGLRNIEIAELKSFKGIKETKAIEILAAIEFGKRVCIYNENKPIINTSKDMYELVKFDMIHLTNEEFRVAYLNRRSEIIDIKILSIGTFDNTNVDMREVIRWSLKLGSYHFIVFHNHPSGNHEPSLSDRKITTDLREYAKKMGTVLVDHIIISKNGFYSFADEIRNNQF